MVKYIFFLILLTLGWSSCDCTYSYGVFVENATGEDLQIVFKRKNSNTEEKVTLSNGESTMILQNVEIKPKEDCSGTTASHCQLVAEYVNAYIKDTIKSKTEWCSEKIKFEKMDIEEAEFLIKYSPDDF